MKTRRHISATGRGITTGRGNTTLRGNTYAGNNFYIYGGVAIAQGKNNTAINGNGNTANANSPAEFKRRAIAAVAALDISADAAIAVIQAITEL